MLTEVSNEVDLNVDRFLEQIVGVGLFAEAKDVRDTAISFLSSWLRKPVELVVMLKEGRTYGIFRVNGDAYTLGPYEPSAYASGETIKLLGTVQEH